MTIVEPAQVRFAADPAALPDETSPMADRKSLLSLVLDAVSAVDQSSLRPVAPATAGIAFKPCNLLALLTYCYAAGIYGSQDIEDTLYRDGIFRLICGGEIPDWKSLRRFRRYNHAALQKCLEETCARACRMNGTPCHPRLVPGEATMSNSHRTEGIDRAEISSAVERRLERAMWLDHMAVDD